MNDPNALDPLEFSIREKRRMFTSILDESCAGIMQQKTQSMLDHLNTLEEELSGIERLLDAVIKGENSEKIHR